MRHVAPIKTELWMVGDRGSQTQTQSWLHLNMNTFAGVKMCIKTGGLAPGGTKGRRSPFSVFFALLCAMYLFVR